MSIHPSSRPPSHPPSRPPSHPPSRVDHAVESDRSRWLVLAVLCMSVFVVVIDATIVNVALPTLVGELGASTSELQWIVDAYVLVFAALLMAAGSIGDRFGRKGVMQVGLALFGVFSALAAWSDSTGELTFWRAAMGVGAALLFPATLAILVNVFTDPRERAIAIGAWAATSGLGVALGPVSGGWLLEHFWWGSVFFVNVPIVAVAIVAVARFVPTSRDVTIHRFDVLGTILSVAGVGLLVWAVIEGPVHGWTSSTSISAFTAAALALAAFVAWERRSTHPMLDVGVFANLRFTAGSVSVTFAFFALFGFVFLVTQYFQFVRGYDALQAGIRTVPFALFAAAAAPSAAKLAERFGTKAIVTSGLVSMAAGFAWTTTADAGTSYWIIVGQMALMGGGLGLVQAPATEAIMGSLPPAKAGVGSAVNDTARELGGTLGVAVVGSVFSSVYASRLGDLLGGSPLPADSLSLAKESTGAGMAVADRAGEIGGPGAGVAVRDAVTTSFLDGWHTGSWVSTGVVLAGALVAWRFLPARAGERRRASRAELAAGQSTAVATTENVENFEGELVAADR
jgi:EmrB/QacA subfamily drug resistance transporter